MEDADVLLIVAEFLLELEQFVLFLHDFGRDLFLSSGFINRAFLALWCFFFLFG